MSEVDPVALSPEDLAALSAHPRTRRNAMGHDDLVKLFAHAHLGMPEAITPVIFKSRTAISFQFRGKETLAVDEAYEGFYRAWLTSKDNPEARRFREAAVTLYEALEAMRVAKGGDWTTVKRNVVSNGLLAEWHGYLGTLWAEHLASQRARERAAIASEVARSRFGVMYLLGNVEISMNWAPIVLEGVADLGAAASLGGMDLGARSIDGAAKTVVGGPVRAPAVVTAGSTAVRVGANALGSPASKASRLEAESAKRAIQGPGFYVPTFPATRSMFDEMGRFAREEVDGVDSAIGLVVGGAIGTSVALATDVVVESIRTIGQNLVQAVVSFINVLRDKLFKDDLFAARLIGSATKGIVSIVVAEVAKAAVPFLSGGLKIGEGLAKTAMAVKDKIALWLDSRKVTVVDGHFSLIADSIEWSVTKGMLYGLWDALKGAGDIAMNVFLPGAGSLVSALMTAFEWIARFIMRLVESSRVQTFLTDAKVRWQREKSLAQKELVDGPTGKIARYSPKLDESASLVNKPEAFKEFFKGACDTSTSLPMLTLNSGICGSTFEQIELLSGTRRISQSEFDAGVRYFKRLKSISGVYLRSSGLQFRSDDSYVNGIIAFAVREHTTHSGLGSKALAFLGA
jgi:hypothetical protein